MKVLSYIISLCLLWSTGAMAFAPGFLQVAGGGGGVVGPSYIVNDTFTEVSDTELSVHTGETGASWSVHAASGGGVLTVSGTNDRLECNVQGQIAIYLASGTPSTADYSVFADMYVASAAASSNVSVIGRMSDSTVSGYGFRLKPDDPIIQLFRFDSGALTELGAYTPSPTMSNGSTYALELRMNGSSIKLFVDGTERISVTDSTFSSAGRIGVRGYSGDGTLAETAIISLSVQ